jgi:hypothetical protein
MRLRGLLLRCDSGRLKRLRGRRSGRGDGRFGQSGLRHRRLQSLNGGHPDLLDRHGLGLLDGLEGLDRGLSGLLDELRGLDGLRGLDDLHRAGRRRLDRLWSLDGLWSLDDLRLDGLLRVRR